MRQKIKAKVNKLLSYQSNPSCLVCSRVPPSRHQTASDKLKSLHPAELSATQCERRNACEPQPFCPLARRLSAPDRCGLGTVYSHDVSSCWVDNQPTSNTRELHFLIGISIVVALRSSYVNK